MPHFRDLKNTDTDVGLVTGAFARLGRDFRIFAGLELPTLPMLSIGGCGMMITASNVAPRMVSQMYDTFAKGEGIHGFQRLGDRKSDFSSHRSGGIKIIIYAPETVVLFCNF